MAPLAKQPLTVRLKGVTNSGEDLVPPCTRAVEGSKGSAAAWAPKSAMEGKALSPDQEQKPFAES